MPDPMTHAAENDGPIDCAAVLAVLLTTDDPADELRDLMSQAWDEGYRAGFDHGALDEQSVNPYRPIQPGTSEETR